MDQEQYLTAWNPSRVDCTDHHILKDLYESNGPRTAQAFVLRMGFESIDVVNCHAPSGAP